MREMNNGFTPYLISKRVKDNTLNRKTFRDD